MRIRVMSYCSVTNILKISCNIPRIMGEEGPVDKMEASGIEAYGRMLYAG